MMMNETKRIHPVGVILSFIRIIRAYLVPALLFLLFGTDRSSSWYFLLGIIIIIILVVVISVLEWWNYTYRIEAGELRIEHGIFIKKKRYIPIKRIQTVNMSAGIIQQLFGLVKIEFETASGELDAEVILTAVKKQEAEVLQHMIWLYKQDSSEEEKEFIEESVPLFRLQFIELLVAASTSGGIGVILSALLAFITQFDQFLPYDRIFQHVHFLSQASVTLFIILAFITILLAWVLSIIGTLLKYANFYVKKSGENLEISRGIFEKINVSVPISRIQAVRIVENPVRQILGFATIYIETAGGSSDDQGSSVLLFPVVSKNNMRSLLMQLLPNYPHQDYVNRLPKRSKKRYIFRAILPVFLLCLVLVYFIKPWGYFGLLLLPVSFLWGNSQYRNAGWNIFENQLQLEYRLFSKTTLLIKRKRIQAISCTSSFFQRRKSLQTIGASIKAGMLGKHFTIRDIDLLASEKIANWYSARKK